MTSTVPEPEPDEERERALAALREEALREKLRDMEAPSEEEVSRMEMLARAEQQRAGRMRRLAAEQMGAVRSELRKRDKRRQARRARKRNRSR